MLGTAGIYSECNIRISFIGTRGGELLFGNRKYLAGSKWLWELWKENIKCFHKQTM